MTAIRTLGWLNCWTPRSSCRERRHRTQRARRRTLPLREPSTAWPEAEGVDEGRGAVGRRARLVLLVAGLLATVLQVAPARAGANRCETTSQPTAVDQGGVWYQSPAHLLPRALGLVVLGGGVVDPGPRRGAAVPRRRAHLDDGGQRHRRLEPLLLPEVEARRKRRRDRRVGRLATQSAVPMFICEMWIDTTDPATVESWQRIAQADMDERLIGGVRVLYGPSAGNGTHTREGVEAHWIEEFARPYVSWVGDTIQSIAYDYDARRLVTVLALDGSSNTSEVYTSLARTYPSGFRVITSSGGLLVHDGNDVLGASGGLTWDAVTQRIGLPAGSGPVTVTVEPR